MSPITTFFEDVKVIVMDGVYEPAEDTFLLCQHLNVKSGDRVLELGTGCGLASIVAANKGAHVVATDQSPLAVKNAKENVKRHNLQDRVEVRVGWLFDSIHQNERFSVIAFNPPYLPGNKQDPAFDPAWSGGKNGREITEAFLQRCSQFLEPKGRILLLQSSLSNADRTHKMLRRQFHNVSIKGEKAFFFERLFLFEAEQPC